jgi:hypothetical protein
VTSLFNLRVAGGEVEVAMLQRYRDQPAVAVQDGVVRPPDARLDVVLLQITVVILTL